MTASSRLARIFKVLSLDTRVRMVCLLKERPMCVNALAQHLGITAAAASQHLRILRDADLVTAEKRGYFVHYRLNEATLAEWNEAAKSLLDTGRVDVGLAAKTRQRLVPKQGNQGGTEHV